MPIEFTPEINEEFLNRLTQRRRGREAEDIGAARSEALSRGLTGDPFEASAVGAARESSARDIGDTEADFYYRLAGLGREERLGREGREYESSERQKGRDFQERMAALDYQRRRDLQEREGEDQLTGGIIGAGAGLLGRIGGGLASKYGLPF